MNIKGVSKMSFTYDDAYKANLEYFNGDELAAKVFVDKYARRNDVGELIELTPDDMHKRLADEFVRIEQSKFEKPLSYNEIYEAFKGFKRLIPQGSPMFGIGTNQFVTISNCYVVEPPVDSYGGIHYTDQCITQISKRRGGVGTDLSHLRPERSATRNSSRTSSGIISFAKRFSNSIREVGQDGRRGALMLTLSVHHPDIVSFAKAKQNKEVATGCNMAIRLTDEFLQAVEEDGLYEQRWPVDGKTKISRFVRAREVWDIMIDCAWAFAEPGLMFWDTIIRESPADCYAKYGFETVSTNPCGELPLCVNDSCRLLLLNVFSYVQNPFTQKATFDWTAFYNDARLAQRLMDDMIDLELEFIDRIIEKVHNDPEPYKYKELELNLWLSIREKCQLGRRTGTGLTGLGDTLAALGIEYGSEDGINTVERIYRTLKFGVYQESVDLAKKLGTFEVWSWNAEKDCTFFQRFMDETVELNDGYLLMGYDLYDDMALHGRRNIGLMTTAPAGTTSILTQTTSGGEPLVFIEAERKKKICPSDKSSRVDFTDVTGDQFMIFKVYHPKVKMWMDITGETDITKSPWYGCCAEDLDPACRVKQQAVSQRHVDHAISSTVNLHKDATRAEVAKVYETAWHEGCKGITVYRAGCRDGIITKVSDEDTNERPRTLPCDVYHISVRGQKYFVLVGLKDGKPYEVFAGKNGFIDQKIKTGNIIRKRKGYYICQFNDSDLILSPITASTSEMEEAVTRLASAALKHGANIQYLVAQLEKVGEKSDLQSFCRSISRALKKYIKDGAVERGEICPECGGGPIVRQQGCQVCLSCAWSKCI